MNFFQAPQLRSNIRLSRRKTESRDESPHFRCPTMQLDFDPNMETKKHVTTFGPLRVQSKVLRGLAQASCAQCYHEPCLCHLGSQLGCCEDVRWPMEVAFNLCPTLVSGKHGTSLAGAGGWRGQMEGGTGWEVVGEDSLWADQPGKWIVLGSST